MTKFEQVLKEIRSSRPKDVSKPGAVIQAFATKVPPSIQAAIESALSKNPDFRS